MTDDDITAAVDAWATREDRYRPGVDTAGEVVNYQDVILAFLRSPEHGALAQVAMSDALVTELVAFFSPPDYDQLAARQAREIACRALARAKGSILRNE